METSTQPNMVIYNVLNRNNWSGGTVQVNDSAHNGDGAIDLATKIKRQRLQMLIRKLVGFNPENAAGTTDNNDEYTNSDTVPDEPLDLTYKPSDKKQTMIRCRVCNEVHNSISFAKHTASHHRSRSSTSPSARSYICLICGRSFARSDMLTRHTRRHSGIKPYACSVCSQGFSRSDHLATHQRTHTGEKPYSCTVCSYAACRKDMITRHMRTHNRHLPVLNDKLVTNKSSLWFRGLRRQHNAVVV